MRHVGWSAIALGALVWMNLAHGAEAQRLTPIAIGETAAPGEVVESQLREALNEELGEVRGVRVAPTPRAQYVLRGSVTRLEVRGDADRRQLECEVSLVVADRRGGAVRMMLSGRAVARGPEVDRLGPQVVRAAVRGALRPLGTQRL
ncbi:MAG: hypothetical protein H6724_16365 [Sandaracinus sp.]|nr:hypothetical protein [Sandaracinus sp.]